MNISAAEPGPSASSGDALLSWLLGAGIVMSTAANAIRLHAPAHWAAWPVIMLALAAGIGIAAVLVRSVAVGRWTAAELGFSFGKGTLISLTAICAIQA